MCRCVGPACRRRDCLAVCVLHPALCLDRRAGTPRPRLGAAARNGRGGYWRGFRRARGRHGREVGETGRVYATELSAERRAAIEERVTSAAIDNVRVMAAKETDTGLPDQCCDAVYLRAVLHHITDHQAFATSLTRTLRPGGRVGIIDFAPGTLWFHGADHGVRADTVVSVFRSAGLRLRDRDDDWGGGMFLLVFERER